MQFKHVASGITGICCLLVTLSCANHGGKFEGGASTVAASIPSDTARYAPCPVNRRWGAVGYTTDMDIIVVQFDTLRRVCIEGRDAGFTRQKIVIRRDADVRVSLAGPLDYSQPYDQVIATGGKWNLPRQIYFQGASK